MEVSRDLAAQLRHEATLRFRVETKDGQLINAKDLPDTAKSILVFEVKSPERMLDWILSFGKDAKILGPADLIEKAKERLGIFVDCYSDGNKR